MAAELRCTHCGQSIPIHPTTSGKARCMHCGKRMTVPPLLASLPTPQIPGETLAPVPGEEDVPLQIEISSEPEAGEPVAAVMARMMPWVISTLMHAGLMLVMVFVAMVVVIPTGNVPAIPNTLGPLVVEGTERTVEESSPLEAPERATQTSEYEGRGFSPIEGAVAIDPGKTGDPIDLIGKGMGGAGSLGLAPRGPARPPGGPRTIFDPRADHIVFVIDKSGSMIEEFDRVRYAMLTDIGRLVETQTFHVILFADGPPEEFTPRRLVAGEEFYKVKAAEWLETVRPGNTAGSTDPTASLSRAFDVLAHADKRRPNQLILLLTDGVFLDNDKVVKLIDTRNADRKIRVNTYLYGYRPPEAVKTMKTIALRNKGLYKYISPEE